METKYKLYPTQGKISFPVFKSLWPLGFLSVLLASIVQNIDFCAMHSWPILGELFQQLSTYKLVINTEALIKAKQSFETQAICAVSVIYAPIKIFVFIIFVLGMYGGATHYKQLPDMHFSRKGDLISGFLLFFGLVGLILFGGGDGEGGMLHHYIEALQKSYYSYLFFFIAGNIFLTAFILFHSGFYFVARCLRKINSKGKLI